MFGTFFSSLLAASSPARTNDEKENYRHESRRHDSRFICYTCRILSIRFAVAKPRSNDGDDTEKMHGKRTADIAHAVFADYDDTNTRRLWTQTEIWVCAAARPRRSMNGVTRVVIARRTVRFRHFFILGKSLQKHRTLTAVMRNMA